ncbi:MAG: dihydropteroate synthase [Candidatus Omnitrophota bacterium]
MVRVIKFSDCRDIRETMHSIGVDPYGIRIMVPKAQSYSLFIAGLSNISANILKQEMLSLGADVALAKGALTGKSRKTDCLIMGNLSQLGQLNKKMGRQQFGLGVVSDEISSTLKNYERDNFILDLKGSRLRLGSRTHIMGILNLTPDSFSADGIYGGSHASRALEYSEKLVEDGADIIDIGGESTRPGARPVSLQEELSRTIPVIKALAKKIRVPISIDTYKPQVADRALDNGASIINDITGLRDPKMAKIAARHGAGVVIMHMKGNPRTMQKSPSYNSLMDEIIVYLNNAILRALDAGIDKEKIIIDPGIGFGKSFEHNLQILRQLHELKVLGRPILAGVSRKSFIGKILGKGPQERVFGTVSSCVLAAESGARILRVHDVKAVKEAVKVLDLTLRT